MPKAKAKAKAKKTKGSAASKTVDLKDLRPGELELFNAEENSGDGDEFDEDTEVKNKYLTSTRFLEDERSDEASRQRTDNIDWQRVIRGQDQDSSSSAPPQGGRTLIETLRRNGGGGGRGFGVMPRPQLNGEPLLPLAKARVLALWVAYVTEIPNNRPMDTQMELMQLGLGRGPGEISAAMTQLGVRLAEQRMLDLDDLEDLKQWSYSLKQRLRDDSGQSMLDADERLMAKAAGRQMGLRTGGGRFFDSEADAMEVERGDAANAAETADVLVRIEWLRRKVHPASDGDGVGLEDVDEEVGPEGYSLEGISAPLREPLLPKTPKGTKGDDDRDSDEGTSSSSPAAVEEVEMQPMSKSAKKKRRDKKKAGLDQAVKGDEEKAVSKGVEEEEGEKSDSHAESKDFSHSTGRISAAVPVEEGGKSGKERKRSKKGKSAASGGASESSVSTSALDALSVPLLRPKSLPPPPGPEAGPLRALNVLFRANTAVDIWQSTEVQQDTSRWRQSSLSSPSSSASSSPTGNNGSFGDSTSNKRSAAAKAAAAVAASERKPLLGGDDDDDEYNFNDDSAHGKARSSNAALQAILSELEAVDRGGEGGEEIAARQALADAKRALAGGGRGGGGVGADRDDGEEEKAKAEKDRLELETGAAIKRVVFNEALHLLSPPEACLLTCWLGDDEERDEEPKIAELSAALEQVEAWSSTIAELIAPSSPFSEQRSRVMSVVKTAHWHLVKLHETRNDYAAALKAHENLKNSRLVSFMPDELRVVDMTARQYRWSELKERSDELFNEGQYTACRALHANALSDPPRFIANPNHKAVSEQVIRNCDHKAKHEVKIFAKAKAGAARSKQAREQQQAREQTTLANLGSKHRAQAGASAAAGGCGGEADAAGSEGNLLGGEGGDGMWSRLFEHDDDTLLDRDVAQQLQQQQHDGPHDADGRARSDPSVDGLVEFACSLTDTDLRAVLALTDGPTALSEANDSKLAALSLGSGAAGAAPPPGGKVGEAAANNNSLSTSLALVPAAADASAAALEESEADTRRLVDGAQDCAAVAEAGRFLTAAEALHEGVEGLHALLAGGEGEKAAPTRPSKNMESFSCQLREAWPCQQNVAEFVQGQPTKMNIFECMTCRGSQGAGGRLHLVCDFCMRINHRHHGHRTRPMGSSFTCDDRTRSSPWCPVLSIKPLPPTTPPPQTSSADAASSELSPDSGVRTALEREIEELAEGFGEVEEEKGEGEDDDDGKVMDDLMAELAESSATAIMSSPGAKGKSKEQLELEEHAALQAALATQASNTSPHFLRCVLCTPSTSSSGEREGGGIPASYHGSSLGGGRDVVFPTELTANHGAGTLGWALELEMPPLIAAATTTTASATSLAACSANASALAAKKAWVKAMLQKARFPHALLLCVEQSKAGKMEKLNNWTVKWKKKIATAEADLAKAERAASLAADVLGYVDEEEDGGDGGSGGSTSGGDTAVLPSTLTPSKKSKEKLQEVDGGGRPLKPLDMVCYFCLKKRDLEDEDNGLSDFKRCLGAESCGRTFCSDCLSFHEHGLAGADDHDDVVGDDDEEGAGVPGGSFDPHEMLERRGLINQKQEENDEIPGSILGNDEDPLVANGLGEGLRSPARKSEGNDDGQGGEGESKAVSMHRIVANAHAWAAGRDADGNGESSGGGRGGDGLEDDQEADEFGAGVGLRKRKNARAAARNARATAWTSSVAPASGSEGSNDDDDIDHDLEAGLIPGSKNSLGKQKARAQAVRGGGVGMSEIEKDVVRLKKKRDDEHHALAADLLEMQIDLWLMRSLYQQVAAAALAHRLRVKLERAKAGREESAKLAVSRAKELEAEEAMREMLEELEVGKNSGAGKRSKGGGGHGDGGGGGDSGDAAAEGEGGAKKVLTKKQKEKERARAKKEADMKVAVEAEEKAKAKREAHEQAQRDGRRRALMQEQELRKQARDMQEQQQAAEALATEARVQAEEERMLSEAVKASEEELVFQQRLLAEDAKRRKENEETLVAAQIAEVRAKAEAATAAEAAAKVAAAAKAKTLELEKKKAAADKVAAEQAAAVQRGAARKGGAGEATAAAAAAKNKKKSASKQAEGVGERDEAVRNARIARAAQQQQEEAARAASAARAAAAAAAAANVAAPTDRREASVEAAQEKVEDDVEEEEESGFVVSFGAGSDEDEEEENKKEVASVEGTSGASHAEPPPHAQYYQQPAPKLRPTAASFNPGAPAMAYAMMPGGAVPMMFPQPYMGVGGTAGGVPGAPLHGMMHPHMLAPPMMTPAGYFVPPPPFVSLPGAPDGGAAGGGGGEGVGEGAVEGGDHRGVDSASGDNGEATPADHAAAQAAAVAWHHQQQWQLHQMYMQQHQQQGMAPMYPADFSGMGPPGSIPPEVLAHQQQLYQHQQQLYKQQSHQPAQNHPGQPMQRMGGPGEKPAGSKKQQRAAAAAAAAAAAVAAQTEAVGQQNGGGTNSSSSSSSTNSSVAAAPVVEEPASVEQEEVEESEEERAASAIRRTLQIASPARNKKASAKPAAASTTAATTQAAETAPPLAAAAAAAAAANNPQAATTAGDSSPIDTLLALRIAPWLSKEYAIALLGLVGGSTSSSVEASVQAACELVYEDERGDLQQRLDRVILQGGNKEEGGAGAGGSGRKREKKKGQGANSQTSAPSSPPSPSPSPPPSHQGTTATAGTGAGAAVAAAADAVKATGTKAPSGPRGKSGGGKGSRGSKGGKGISGGYR